MRTQKPYLVLLVPVPPSSAPVPAPSMSMPPPSMPMPPSVSAVAARRGAVVVRREGLAVVAAVAAGSRPPATGSPVTAAPACQSFESLEGVCFYRDGGTCVGWGSVGGKVRGGVGPEN